MRVKLFPAAFLCLICAFAAAGQTIDEKNSSARFGAEGLEVTLPVTARAKAAVPAVLELLDPADKVVASTSTEAVLDRGRQRLRLVLPLPGAAGPKNDEMIWHRVRYRVGNAFGIVSLSQLLEDVFDLRVAASAEVTPGMIYRVRVTAFNPFTEASASSVRINGTLTFDLKSGDEDSLELKAEGLTDGNGNAVLEFRIPSGAHFDDDGEIEITATKNGVVRTASDDLESVRTGAEFLMLTDKALYQPEQTINIRGIYLEGIETKTVNTGREVDIRIEDEEDTVVYREKLRTSEFGIAAVSWNIPPNAKLGTYTIRVRDEFGEDIGRQNLKVSRYDLPNFVVKAEPDKGYYLPGDEVAEFAIRADYLFGKPVTRGKVRVVEEKDRRWNWREQKYDIDEGQVFEGETDAEGKFVARYLLEGEFATLRDESHRKYIDVMFAAYFTDPTTNRNEQRRFDIRLTREPIHVYFSSARDDRHSSLPVQGYVTAFYADGTPAECEVEITASEYDDEGFRRVLKTRTNRYGVAKAEFRAPKFEDHVEELHLRIAATDREGRKGTLEEEISFAEEGENGISLSIPRVILKEGEPIRMEVRSARREGQVRVDVVRGWTLLSSHGVRLQNGRGSLAVPFDPFFQGEIKIIAYTEPTYEDDDIVRSLRQVIFPVRQNLKVDARFGKAIYKPGEDATLTFDIADAGGRPVESALGVAIVDTAVEHRARTDTEFGSMMSNYLGWLGYGGSIGSVNIKDIRDLDLSTPIPNDLQIVAGALLNDTWYEPGIFFSDDLRSDARRVFARHYKPQDDMLRRALSAAFSANGQYPRDERSLREVLSGQGISLPLVRDPWGEQYRPEFGYDKENAFVRFISNGPDKRPGTADDFAVSNVSLKYFTPTGKIIDEAILSHRDRTGNIIRDRDTLLGALGRKELNDIYGRPYQFDFSVDGRHYVMRITSLGRDGRRSEYSWSGDDFTVWTNRTDYFAELENRITVAQSRLSKIPMTAADFKASLASAGIDLDTITDGYGNKVYVVVNRYTRFSNRVTTAMVREYGVEGLVERRTVTPVTQDVISFRVRTAGSDRTEGTWRDLTLTEIIHVISERTKDDPEPVIKNSSFSSGGPEPASGAISGTVKDETGSVIVAATVTATHLEMRQGRTVVTNDSGRYIISGLSPGRYELKAEAPGFKSAITTNIPVTSGVTTNYDFQLEVGSVDSVVTVTAESDSVVNTSDASLGNTITSQQITSLPLAAKDPLALLKLQPGAAGGEGEGLSTPRLRQYFPETLLWNPELITGADGKAAVNFKMADNITTWKAYTIASTRDGRVGVAEQEVTAFQSFFADLDPPKILTEGDEIYLPVQVRNYTESTAKVDVTMDDADWFSFLTDARQKVDVASGETENAVFGFRASRPVKDGLQRVTALAEKDSDAIEKPVTVKPNGHEVVRSESKYFSGNAELAAEFPANALPGTPRAELKIYPNLFAHITESVEGLLQRPYGCGEQTVSSTYPNLMIVEFNEEDTPLRRRAMRNLIRGKERLLGYQAPEGGFTYWGGASDPDIALTAYALRFLHDAGRHIAVDESVIERAERWLLAQQRQDGGWSYSYSRESATGTTSSTMLTTYVVRSFSMRKEPAQGEGAKTSLEKAISFLHRQNAAIDDPYTLSLLGSILLANGDRDGAAAVAKRLAGLARDEAGSAYWNLESNTPFYGWGRTARIETTALAAGFLAQLAESDVAYRELVEKAMVFLFRNKDRYGVWFSTQTTINVLETFLAAMKSGERIETAEVVVSLNGRETERLKVPSDRLEPIVVDLTDRLLPGRNEIVVGGPERYPLLANLVAGHYVDWEDADISSRDVNVSRAIELDVNCPKTEAAIMETLICSVRAERVGFRGYGMLLAEIGTPPGADVDREALQEAMKGNTGISRYDILPDRVVVYMWARGGGTRFDLKFRPRYAINAQTPASVVYDYYNPEAQATAAPVRFRVR